METILTPIQLDKILSDMKFEFDLVQDGKEFNGVGVKLQVKSEYLGYLNDTWEDHKRSVSEWDDAVYEANEALESAKSVLDEKHADIYEATENFDRHHMDIVWDMERVGSGERHYRRALKYQLEKLGCPTDKVSDDWLDAAVEDLLRVVQKSQGESLPCPDDPSEFSGWSECYTKIPDSVREHGCYIFRVDASDTSVFRGLPWLRFQLTPLDQTSKEEKETSMLPADLVKTDLASGIKDIQGVLSRLQELLDRLIVDKTEE